MFTLSGLFFVVVNEMSQVGFKNQKEGLPSEQTWQFVVIAGAALATTPPSSCPQPGCPTTVLSDGSSVADAT